MRDGIQLLTRLVVAQARRQEVGIGHADRSVSARVRDFINLDLPVFTGADPNEDPQVFIDRMQRTLRVMKATLTESVELASYRLQDVAVNWYESWELSRGEDAPPAVWQEFTEAFLHHYLPLELRWARVDRFLTLRQGNMSVREYSLQFDLLARYAPTIVSKMEDRVHRFVMGLEPHLLNNCMSVSLHPYMDISSIQAYAQGVEERKQKQRADREHDRAQNKRARSSGPSGSTLSYVTLLVASKFGIKFKLVKPFEVSTPVGESVIAKRVYRGCIIVSHSRSTVADLIELDIVEFDVIMGMDWLASCHTNVDCRSKIVRFPFPREPVLEWKGYYRRFVEGFSSLSSPLTKLTQKGAKFQWTDACKRSFQELKDKLTSAPGYVGREAHYSCYSIHPGVTKMYHDIREVYWWDGMKMDIAEFVA
ncbi:uncharacterized protein [Nicotiana tomentosiformis]|uniref:uncharacterized protein n=1 Tax=Nicotiana tomentosiformis TaxID=4098 RepID=UPI00388C92F3